MHYYLAPTGLNNEHLPCHDECELLCLLAHEYDLLNLLCSLLIRCCDEIRIRYADLDHGFRFYIFVLLILDGLVRFRKILLDFLIILFRLHIRQGEILLISIHTFCYRDAYSFHQCVGVRFKCLFREHVFMQLILSFLEIFVHFCNLNYFILRNLIDCDL